MKETLLSSKFNILVVELSCAVFFLFYFFVVFVFRRGPFAITP